MIIHMKEGGTSLNKTFKEYNLVLNWLIEYGWIVNVATHYPLSQAFPILVLRFELSIIH